MSFTNSVYHLSRFQKTEHINFTMVTALHLPPKLREGSRADAEPLVHAPTRVLQQGGGVGGALPSSCFDNPPKPLPSRSQLCQLP